MSVLGLIMSISHIGGLQWLAKCKKKRIFGHNFFNSIILLKNVELWIRVEGGSENVNRDFILFLWDL